MIWLLAYLVVLALFIWGWMRFQNRINPQAFLDTDPQEYVDTLAPVEPAQKVWPIDPEVDLRRGHYGPR
jgi:hypothetical protein